MADSDSKAPTCPNCGGQGRATAVMHKGQQRTITYECDVCHRLWDITNSSLRATLPQT